MKSAFVFQGLNLGVSVGILLIALIFLNTDDYLLWILFTTIGSGLINLESALNAVSTRAISRAWLDGSSYSKTVRLVGRGYAQFSSAGSIFMAVAGGLYLTSVDYGAKDCGWLIPWIGFCLAYFIYYLTSYRSCQLVAIGAISTFTVIGSFGRLMNLAIAAALAWAGYGLLGLSIAVLASFVLTGLLLELTGRKSIRQMASSMDIQPATQTVGMLLRKSGMQAAFAVSSYFLYRAVFLYLSTAMPSAMAAASLGLAIQIYGFLLILAAVPLNMRIAPLIAAGRTGDPEAIAAELGHLGKLVNLAIVTASAALIFLGPEIFKLVPTLAATLPPRSTLVILALCFWLEANLLIFVNMWLAIDRFDFVRLYLFGFVIAWFAVGMAIISGHASVNLLLLTVLAVQSGITAPVIVRRMHRDLGVSLTNYLRAIWRARLHLSAVL